MPRWYPLLRAARYLGVPPWELERQPIWWRDRALMAEGAEQQAEGMARRLSKLPGFKDLR